MMVYLSESDGRMLGCVLWTGFITLGLAAVVLVAGGLYLLGQGIAAIL